MKKLTDPSYYYRLFDEYLRTKRPGDFDCSEMNEVQYNSFREWAKQKYNVDNDGTVVLTFENDEDCTIFLLKWT